LAVAGRDPVVVRAWGRAPDAVVVVCPPVALRDAAAAGVGRAADAAGAGAHTATVEAGEAAPVRASGRLAGDRLVVTVDGVTRTYAVALDGDTLWLGRDGGTWAVHEQGPVDAVAAETTGAGGPVRSPMPGTVTLVEVADGQTVTAGDRLVVVEAMKMEHVLTAPVDGVVRDLRAKAGATVAKDAVLLSVEITDAEER
jgi:acetyl-CoA/propionyl-CoA carboxylase biotin carboxyl carrier protein